MIRTILLLLFRRARDEAAAPQMISRDTASPRLPAVPFFPREPSACSFHSFQRRWNENENLVIFIEASHLSLAWPVTSDFTVHKKISYVAKRREECYDKQKNVETRPCIGAINERTRDAIDRLDCYGSFYVKSGGAYHNHRYGVSQGYYISISRVYASMMSGLLNE